MTNLLNLSLKKKNQLIIIHGLNNNSNSFLPLTNHFREQGLEIHFVTLPSHGHDRQEAKDFKEAFACFDRSMRELTSAPFSVLAFSQGALFLQLWLEKRPDQLPLAQVLLSPALYIHRQGLIENMTKILPSFFPIKSFSPKSMRRYGFLTVGEYRILVEALIIYQKLKTELKVPTLILVDPKDELVDASALKEKFNTRESAILNFVLFTRPYLKKGLGCHHIMFHPEYFSQADWKVFTSTIEVFLQKSNPSPAFIPAD
jgi:pimeloyl-ACP methyl ester carboxylesterase